MFAKAERDALNGNDADGSGIQGCQRSNGLFLVLTLSHKAKESENGYKYCPVLLPAKQKHLTLKMSSRRDDI